MMLRSLHWLLPGIPFVVAPGLSPDAHAADAVDEAPVLVIDVSRSTDNREFGLERKVMLPHSSTR